MDLENKIMRLYNQKLEKVKQRKIVNLLKLVLVDRETDLDKILIKVPITYPTLKKYLNEKEQILCYLTKQQADLFNEKILEIFEIYEKKVENEELSDVRRIIDDIYNTRHKLSDIYSKNFVPRAKFEEIIKSGYLDIHFGKGTTEKLKDQIQKNRLIREKKPRNMFLIEYREDIYFAKEDLFFLNQFDYKRLKYASSYLSSAANLDYLIKKYDTSIFNIIAILSDLKLENVLKTEHYENLMHCINIEKMLADNRISEKKELLFNVVLFLQQNNFDKEFAMLYFKTPKYLFDRVINEILRMPYFDAEIKKDIQDMLIQKEENKVK